MRQAILKPHSFKSFNISSHGSLLQLDRLVNNDVELDNPLRERPNGKRRTPHWNFLSQRKPSRKFYYLRKLKNNELTINHYTENNVPLSLRIARRTIAHLQDLDHLDLKPIELTKSELLNIDPVSISQKDFLLQLQRLAANPHRETLLHVLDNLPLYPLTIDSANQIVRIYSQISIKKAMEFVETMKDFNILPNQVTFLWLLRHSGGRQIDHIQNLGTQWKIKTDHLTRLLMWLYVNDTNLTKAVMSEGFSEWWIYPTVRRRYFSKAAVKLLANKEYTLQDILTLVKKQTLKDKLSVNEKEIESIVQKCHARIDRLNSDIMSSLRVKNSSTSNVNSVLQHKPSWFTIYHKSWRGNKS